MLIWKEDGDLPVDLYEADKVYHARLNRNSILLTFLGQYKEEDSNSIFGLPFLEKYKEDYQNF